MKKNARNERDFIDFTIELIVRRKILYFILAIFLAYATYFNLIVNDKFKYKSTIKIAPESHLVPIINNLNVYNTAADVWLNPLTGKVSYKSLMLELCDLVMATTVDQNFIDMLVKDFMEKNLSYKDREVVRSTLRNTIKRVQSDPAKVCLKVEVTSSADYINYLHKYYANMINMYLEIEIYNRLNLIRLGKINFLQSSLDSTKVGVIEPVREGILSKLELNALEERQVVVLSKLELVKSTEIADTNVDYIIWSVTKVGQTLNAIFLYAFAIFMSIIIFVLTIVLIDYRKQFILRQSTEN